MKFPLKLLIALLAVCASAQAQTVNITFTFTDGFGNKQTNCLATLTPLSPFVGYAGNILNQVPNRQITDTNGSCVFSNVVSGYKYQEVLATPYNTTTNLIGIPAGTTGNVNGFNYVGTNVGPYFAYLFLTNPIAAGTNIVITTNGGVLTINSTGGGASVAQGANILTTTNAGTVTVNVAINATLTNAIITDPLGNPIFEDALGAVVLLQPGTVANTPGPLAAAFGSNNFALYDVLGHVAALWTNNNNVTLPSQTATNPTSIVTVSTGSSLFQAISAVLSQWATIATNQLLQYQAASANLTNFSGVATNTIPYLAGQNKFNTNNFMASLTTTNGATNQGPVVVMGILYGNTLLITNVSTNLNFLNATNFGRTSFLTNATYPMPGDNILIQLPDYGYLHFGNNTSGNGNIWWDPAHAPDGELQFTSYGRISLLAGYDQLGEAAIQIGAPGSAGFNYNAANDVTLANTAPLGASLPYLFETQVFSNSTTHWYWPGVVSEARLTNASPGHWALRFIDTLQQANGQPQNAPNQTSWGTTAGLAIWDNGTEQHGRITADLSPTTTATNFTINFDSTMGQEIQLTNNITFSLGNSFYPRTNQLTQQFLRIYSATGTNYTITWPTNLPFMSDAGPVAAPTNMWAGSCLQVTVSQEIGALSNYYARAAYVYSPPLDPDAQTFLSNTGVGAYPATSNSFSANQLVVDLKTDGSWGNLVAAFPAAFGTLQAVTNDLKHTYGGIIGGTVTISLNGLRSDGTSGYFNSTVPLSTAISSMNSLMMGFNLESTNVNLTNGQYFMGVTDGGAGHVAAATTDTSGMYPFGLNNNNVDNPIIPVKTGLYIINRTANTAQIEYLNYTTTRTSTTTAATGLPGGSGGVYFLAEGFNNGGSSSPLAYSTATLNFFVIGQNFTDTGVKNLTGDIIRFNARQGR